VRFPVEASLESRLFDFLVHDVQHCHDFIHDSLLFIVAESVFVFYVLAERLAVDDRAGLEDDSVLANEVLVHFPGAIYAKNIAVY